eukprot:5255592-Amphidinium_carterae.1
MPPNHTQRDGGCVRPAGLELMHTTRHGSDLAAVVAFSPLSMKDQRAALARASTVAWPPLISGSDALLNSFTKAVQEGLTICHKTHIAFPIFKSDGHQELHVIC